LYKLYKKLNWNSDEEISQCEGNESVELAGRGDCSIVDMADTFKRKLGEFGY